MEIKVVAGDIARTKADAIVVNFFEGMESLDGDIANIDKALDGAISQLINQGEKRELAEKLEILRLWLESGELPGLRRESEKHLVDGRRVKFIFYLEKGIPKYKMKIT